MTFPVSTPLFWSAGIVGFGLGAVLCWIEWRRADRRNLWWRLAATAGAVLALTFLGLRPAWQQNIAREKRVEAIVWTGGGLDVNPVAQASSRTISDAYKFVLNGAKPLTGEAATPIPDLGYLRRHFPEIDRVKLVGDGLLASELEPLRGCALTFKPAAEDAKKPVVDFVSWPSELRLGESLIVQGRITGAKDRAAVAVSLVAPDGTVTNGSIRDGAGADGPLVFEVKSLPTAAVGRFVWRLRLNDTTTQKRPLADEEFGVPVINPKIPRVLVLESSPHLDTANLRRWWERLGGLMTVRTTVGRERFRFASTHGATPDFQSVDETLLANFDLLLADPAALAALTAQERAILIHDVSQAGLGVLSIAPDTQSSPDSALESPAASNPAAQFLSAGKLVPLDAAADNAAGSTRLVRPQWEGQPRVSDILIPATPADIRLSDPTAIRLITDGQDHTLAASIPRGRGHVGITLVQDTWRWALANDEAAFANYWSFLISRLARPVGTTDAGHWSLRGGGQPIFFNEPLELTWTGKGTPPQPATVTYVVENGSGTPFTTQLALAQSPDVGPTWSATFWPREAGWHRVTLPPTGASLDFFVNRNGWQSFRQAARRAATERFAAFSQENESHANIGASPAPASRTVPLPPGWLYGVFLVSAGFLWAERWRRGKS